MGFLRYFDKPYLLCVATKWVGLFSCAAVKIDPSSLESDLSNIQFLTEDSSVLQKLNRRSWINCAAATFQFFQLIVLSTNIIGDLKSHPSHELILGWYNCLTVSGTSYMIFVCRRKGPALKMYLNNLLNFYNRYKPKIRKSKELKFSSMSILEWLHLLLVPMLLISSIVFPPLYVLGVHFINPCKPSLIGYMALLECQKDAKINTNGLLLVVIGIIPKAVVLVGNICVWLNVLHGALFLLIIVTLIGAMMTTECLQIFLNRLKSSKDVHADALLYREIYVINILCNSVQKGFLGVSMTIGTVGLAMALNLIVEFMNHTVQDEKSIIMMICFGLIVFLRYWFCLGEW